MGTDKVETTPFDSADYLATPEDVALYLEEAFEDGEPEMIAHALGVAARAKGMSEVARMTNLNRESLYKALSKEGNPQLSTLIRVLHALGLKLTVAHAA